MFKAEPNILNCWIRLGVEFESEMLSRGLTETQPQNSKSNMYIVDMSCLVFAKFGIGFTYCSSSVHQIDAYSILHQILTLIHI